jgi:peptide deformylase
VAVREVLRYPDRRLKLPAAPVGRPGPAARRLAADLQETARHFPRTVGIAAPQVGALWRMAYVDCTGHPKVPDAHGPLWLLDPVVVAAEGAEVGREGCLSIPDLTANVRRATRIEVEAGDRRIVSEGFEARCLQHEIDHLDGLLFLDRVDSLTADVFRRVRSS